jgi:hypothetical protein
MPRRSSSLARSPLLHCLGLGLAVAMGVSAVADPAPLEIARQAIDELEQQWTIQNGRFPGEAERAALLDGALTDEILYREALAQGLDELPAVRTRLVKLAAFLSLAPPDASDAERHRQATELGLQHSDPVVRRYLIDAARSRLAARSIPAEPTAAEVAGFIEEHENDFRGDRRVSLSHAFVAGFGPTARKRAEQLAQMWRAGASISDIIEAGDVFYGGHSWPLLSQRELAARLGDSSAGAVADLEPGSEGRLIESSYGFHWVVIHSAIEDSAETIPIAEARARRSLMRERAEQALSREIARLRTRYGLTPGGSS